MTNIHDFRPKLSPLTIPQGGDLNRLADSCLLDRLGKIGYLQVEDEEIEAFQIESSHTIEIDKFVPVEQIAPRYFDSPYYIVPTDNVGQDAFAVIRDAMKGKGTVGVGRVVIRRVLCSPCRV